MNKELRCLKFRVAFNPGYRETRPPKVSQPCLLTSGGREVLKRKSPSSEGRAPSCHWRPRPPHRLSPQRPPHGLSPCAASKLVALMWEQVETSDLRFWMRSPILCRSPRIPPAPLFLPFPGHPRPSQVQHCRVRTA